MNDQAILQLLRTDDEAAMSHIFDRYYAALVRTAYHVVLDEHQAKDLVQEVLFGFWSKRADRTLSDGLGAYLRRAVVNRSIDFLRQKKRRGPVEELTDFNRTDDRASTLDQLATNDLERVILRTVRQLPEKCQLVFNLSRFEDMSHAEIADQLNISKKTIENHMTKALKAIRLVVERYRELGTWLIWYFFLNY